jgi:Lrp/AsnC family transcriptional regulator, leucine-responsive regulatory protein
VALVCASFPLSAIILTLHFRCRAKLVAELAFRSNRILLQDLFEHNLLTWTKGDDIRFLGVYALKPWIFNLIDEIDLKILYILQNNGRRRLADIAEEVALSAPAVMERVKKLEASGVIKGYQALIDGKRVGKDITAFIGVSVGNQRDIDGFASHMLSYADVLECHHVTGDESFILKVKSANTGSLEKLLGQIRSVAGVTRTVTRVVLSTAKENQALELDAGLAESAHPKKRSAS